MFNNIDGTFNTNEQSLQRITLLESLIRNLSISLQAYYVQGRLRTDRATPSSKTDVQAQDLIYDRVLTASNEYVLINNSGTLEWREITLSTF